ncbi:MAG TPA: TolC family protein [Vicinamibacterales bacterium]|nr:TolC family protein [Vicinamibacterales bacterium]
MNAAGFFRTVRVRRQSRRAALTIVATLIWPAAMAAQQSEPPTPLSALIHEVEQRNPSIAASRDAWQASTYAPTQAGAMPGPELMVQQVAVGSPRPFAGFSNSDFAYIGVGVSQELLYPGKRALRAEAAGHDAEAARAESGSVQREVVEAVKLAYVQLAYLQQTLPIFDHHDRLLTQVEQIVESRYRVGQGSQQDVLKAQLQHTKILQAIADRRQQEGMTQARLKQLLGRAQDTPDIVAEPLSLTPFPLSAAEVQQRTREQNPDLEVRSAIVERERTQVALAHKASRPDFAVQYMYQHTASAFRDYYMGTFSVRLPNRAGSRAALAEAEERAQGAAQAMQAEVQRVLADAQQQYVVLQGSRERVTIYEDGLMPQAEATFQAAMTAYASNREDFEAVLSSLADALDVDLAYWQEVADHESALARLERLTGAVRP